jgi:anthranilate phosphoribosyltransferase
MAIATVEKILPKEGFQRAKESLNSGQALKKFKKLHQLSQ